MSGEPTVLMSNEALPACCNVLSDSTLKKYDVRRLFDLPRVPGKIKRLYLREFI
jgi:hypothetical protein